jgi:hypothetical protein
MRKGAKRRGHAFFSHYTDVMPRYRRFNIEGGTFFFK